MSNILYRCPLGAQQRQWRIDAVTNRLNVTMRRTSELSRAELLSLAEADPDANVFLLPHIGSCNDGASDLFDELYGDVVRQLAAQQPS